MAKKSLHDKIFNSNRANKVEVMPKNFADIKAGTRLAIPTMAEIYQYICEIPSGERRTIKQLRADLAQKFNADNTCPIVAGMGVRLSAEYAHEQYVNGRDIKDIAPFWRIIDEESPTAKKLSFDIRIIHDFINAAG